MTGIRGDDAEDAEAMGTRSPSSGDRCGSVCVLEPEPYLEVTVEPGAHGAAELHLHPAGQGFWIARMAARLGADATIVAPLGGETGQAIGHLIEREGLRLSTVAIDDANGSVIDDRRTSAEAITVSGPELSRHGRDDLLGGAFSTAVTSDVFVLAGFRTPVVDNDLYRQLAEDVRRNGVTVVADLSGDTLAAALDGGVDVLKVSDDQLRKDGYLTGDDRDDVRKAIATVREAGAADVVVSRTDAPSIAMIDGELLELSGPDVDPVDSHGGGDSMTGALATALACGHGWETALRLAMAAAIAGVLRHGLASARRQDIDQIARRVTITPIN